MEKGPFLIAGGGIAGLASAIAIARSGRDTAVFEQAPAFEETGAGLQLGPNAIRALKALGAWDAVAPATTAPEEIMISDGQTGRILHRVELGGSFERRFGERYRVVHRSGLLTGLLETARASSRIALNPGKRLTGFENSRSAVVANFADGEQRAGEALIGADGVHSVVRKTLEGASQPASGREILFRTLLPRDKAPALLDPGAISLWLYPGAHLVAYPLSGGHFNLVASAAKVGSPHPTLRPVSPSEVANHFLTAHPDLLALLSLPAQWSCWPGLWREIVPQWARGRVALIGDAAHAMPPFLAQGAAMALEDAVVLGRALEPNENIAAAFRQYEALRRPRVLRVSRVSYRQGYIYHSRGAARLARNLVLRSLAPGAIPTRIRWLYDWRP
ncbi:MAG: FAD-dependent monooxygenase [Hyphomicrobiales bacterium]